MWPFCDAKAPRLFTSACVCQITIRRDVPSAETRGKMQTYSGRVTGTQELPIRRKISNPSKGLCVKCLCVVLDEAMSIKDRQDKLQNHLVVIQLSEVTRHQNRHIMYWTEREMRKSGLAVVSPWWLSPSPHYS